MMDILHSLFYFIDTIIFVFGTVILSIYIIMGVFSASALYRYIHKNKFIDYTAILSSDVAPHVSILAPAYNEGKNVVDNVRSLMSINYVKL